MIAVQLLPSCFFLACYSHNNIIAVKPTDYYIPAVACYSHWYRRGLECSFFVSFHVDRASWLYLLVRVYSVRLPKTQPTNREPYWIHQTRRKYKTYKYEVRMRKIIISQLCLPENLAAMFLCSPCTSPAKVWEHLREVHRFSGPAQHYPRIGRSPQDHLSPLLL